MFNLSGERLFEDSLWKVPDIWKAAVNDNRMRALVLEAVEQIQGYMTFQLDNYIGIDGRPCTYVAFLATAPWNRKRKGEIREFKCVGSTLLAVALLYEFKNTETLTIELYSLPQAEIFYRKIGMYETGKRSEEGLKLMRLEKAEALTLIRPYRSLFMRRGNDNEKRSSK